jgi:protein TonB
VPPKYPDDAMRSHRDGTVSMSVTINRAGKVVDVTVTGSLPKNFGFEDAAINAVRQWQYSPALMAGEPVTVILGVKVDFSVSR